MIADFDRYLKNTTIFEYETKSPKGPTFHRNSNYRPIQIDWICYFSHQSFFQFIDKIINDFNIKIEYEPNIEFKNNFSKKIYIIFLYTIEKYPDKQDKEILKSIFKNLEDFLEKSWSKISYTSTDIKNFYFNIWSKTAISLFNWNINIEKIRQTRNKFIEHINDKDREVNFILKWDNVVWRANMEIYLKNENKKYQFSLCPLLDFCVFIDELLKNK